MRRAESRREGNQTLRAELLREVVLLSDAASKGAVDKKGLFIWIRRRVEEERRGSPIRTSNSKGDEALEGGNGREKTSRSDGKAEEGKFEGAIL